MQMYECLGFYKRQALSTTVEFLNEGPYPLDMSRKAHNMVTRRS